MESAVMSPSEIVDAWRRNIRDFLARTGFSEAQTDFVRDLELETRLEDITKHWEDRDKLQEKIRTGIIMGSTAYRHTTIDTRVAIALLTTFCTAIDDPVTLALWGEDGALQFHRMLCQGTVQESSSMFAELSNLLSRMWEYFPRFAASAILSSTLAFLNMTLLQMEAKDVVLHRDALPFVEYRRVQDGLPEVFAVFIWEKEKFPDVQTYIQAIPIIGDYLNHTNDILSFYREELVGETGNYIHDRAAVTGKSLADTLHEVVEETVNAAERVRRMLGEEAKDAWDQFTKGYIVFHTSNPRYRLRELL